MHRGAELVIKTVDAVINQSYKLIHQNDLIKPGTELKHAPKIFKDDCKINWNNHIDTIHDLIRGLSPYPAAWAELISKNEKLQIKIFKTEKEITEHNYNKGELLSDQKTYLKVAVNGGFIKILELQQSGKKRLPTSDFLRGFQKINEYSFSTKD